MARALRNMGCSNDIAMLVSVVDEVAVGKSVFSQKTLIDHD